MKKHGASSWVCPFASGLAFSILLSSCGGDDAPPVEDEISFELFDSTTLLDDTSLNALVEEAEDGTLRFQGSPSQLAGLAPLNVILAPASATTPRGFMRLVTSVETDGNGLVVHTLPAPVQLAFRKLHVRVSRTLDEMSDAVPWTDAKTGSLSRGLSYSDGYWPTKGFEDYPVNGDGDTSTPYDQVQVKAQLSAGFKYTFSLDVDWGDVYSIPDEVLDCIEEFTKLSFKCDPTNFLPEAKVGFSIEAGADAELNLEGVTFLPYSREFVVAEKDLPEIPLYPLVFYPHVEIVALVEGEASSQFKLSAKAAVSAKAGVNYSSRHGPNLDAPTFDKAFSAPSVFATLTARGKVGVGPRLHLRLYDFAGPYASLLAFAEVRADSQANPCWRLIGGVQGDVGFDIVTPELPVVGTLTLAEFGPLQYGLAETEIDSGSCEPLTTGPGNGQAGDPDQTSFANPTFTPWARSYGGVVDGFPYEGPGAQIEWSELTPTIDGRFMLTGSDTKALMKLGTDGSMIWAKRYVADVPFWRDILIPDLLPGLVVNTTDASLFVVAHPYTFLKVDSFGNLMWAKRLNVDTYRETWLRLSGAIEDGEGGYFVVGTFGEDYIAPAENADGWIMRVSATGRLRWSKRVGEANRGNIVRAVVGFGDGFVIAGSTWDPATSHWTPFVHRYDRDGDVVFQKNFVIDDCQGTYVESGHFVKARVTRDADLLFAHNYTYQGYASGLVKLKPDGTLAWSSQFGSSEFAHLGPVITDMVELPTTGYLATGVYSGAQTASDWWVATLDGVGRPVWAERIGAIDVPETIGRDEEGYPSLLLTNDGGAILGGFGEAHAYPEDALVAMKLRAKDGTIDFGSSSEVERHPLTFADGDRCIHSEDASLIPADLPIAVETISVTVEPVTVEQRTLSP